jgi:hypothetical protein
MSATSGKAGGFPNDSKIEKDKDAKKERAAL